MIKRKRINNEEFTKEVYELIEDEYTFLEEYKDYNTKLLVKHNKCGYEYKVSPANFKGNKSKNGTRCPKCQKTHKRTPEEFVNDVFELVGNEYEVISDFKNATTKVDFKHTVCNHEFKMTPNNFLRGQRCPKCANKVFRTTEQFKVEVYNVLGEDYSVIGDFVCTKTKIKMIHNVCGREYESIPNNILKGHGCNKCKLSKGELAVSKWLSENNIINIPEYRFEDCKSKNALPFDFALLDSDRNIKLLIEYDGVGHYEPFRFSKNKEKNIIKFKETQIRDKIKNEYCLANKIPLLRIPYWELGNIDKILQENEIIKDLICVA